MEGGQGRRWGDAKVQTLRGVKRVLGAELVDQLHAGRYRRTELSPLLFHNDHVSHEHVANS